MLYVCEMPEREEAKREGALQTQNTSHLYRAGCTWSSVPAHKGSKFSFSVVEMVPAGLQRSHIVD